MVSDDECGTPPGTPPRKRKQPKKRTKRRRSSSSSSSSSSEPVPRKSRKKSNRFSKRDVLKLLANCRDESSKGSFTILGNNNSNNVLPQFDPANKTQSIDCWLKKVNECAAIYEWNEKQIIHFSLQKLVGLAKKWLESLPTVIYTWIEWQTKLRKAFPCEENYGRLLEEMLNRTSGHEESLREYFFDKLCLLNRCDIAGKKAVDCIVYGITDRSIRNGAQALNSSEPEDLLNFLCSQKPEPITDCRLKNRPVQTKTNPSYSSKPSVQNSLSNTIVCYNCKTKGHPFYKCSKPITKCKRCNRIGHDDDGCRLPPFINTNPKLNRSDNNPETKTLKIDVGNKSNDKFLKNVTVNDQTLEAYIDFGSECTLMNKTNADMLNLPKTFDGLPLIRGFGHSFVTPLYKSNILLRVDEVEAEVAVLIVDDVQMPTDMIVGQNFTELPCVTVLKDSQKLTFYKCPLYNSFSCNDPNLKLHTADSVNVLKIKVVPIYVEPAFTGDIYVEGYSTVEPGREYCLLEGAYHISNGIGEVVVSNLSHQAITLQKNVLIARATPFIEQKTCQMNRIQVGASSLEPLNKREIQTGAELSTTQTDRLYELLQKYRDCFAVKLEEIGCVIDVEMEIELMDNKPIVYRPYRLSHAERETVRKTVDELLQLDIIQESKSNYASPILMVRKKTGEQRLCVDFRALNNKTVKDRFPLPLIDDQVSNLSGNIFFTTLDLASGYYQIPMAKNSRHLTGFVTPDGHYEFKRMPFGLANAPAVFQRMVNKILGNRRFEYALAYLDDILIPARSVDEMFQRLEDILIIFRQNNLTLNVSKCRFFDTTVNYLGYEVSSRGIQPSEAKVQAVKQFPTPSNIHEVRQFLGLTGFFRKFIKAYGEIAHPLTSLLKKNSEWRWSNVEEHAFNSLKEKLVSRPLLALYDPKLETEVHTDASSLGIGGILMQWQRDSRVLKPVAYFSRQTTPEEKHLHSYELETLAVVNSLRKFRVYLLGLHFKVYTDCAALRTTMTKRDLVPRIARWWLTMSEYTFDIEYRPGIQMSHVDALSRNSKLPADSDESTFVSIYTIEKPNWLLTLQIADPEISRIHNILKPEGNLECKDIRQNYVIKNHAVYRKVDDRLCLVVPRSARWQICRGNHDDIGHLGFAKTLERIQQDYWFPKLRKFVKKYVSACLECAYNKDASSRQKSGHLYPIEKINIPFHTIHIDHLGPFVRSKDGNCYILTIVDGFTKYVFVRAVRDVKTKSTIKVLEKIFYDFGVPARIISDRGTSFTSAAFKSFCDAHGIKHILNAVACPRANGQAERFNQTILNSLASQNAFGNEREWDRCLGKLQFGINNTINSSTHKTATEALFGFKLRDDLANKLAVINNAVPNESNLQNIRNEVSTNIRKNQETQKKRHDTNRAPAPSYELGDLVKIARNNFDNNMKSKKLLSKFVGPYKITEVLGNDRYRISDIPGFNKKGKPYNTVIAVDRMRPWIHVKALDVHNSDSSSDSSDRSSNV